MCSSLTNISFQESSTLTTICDSAFQECSNLQEITFQESSTLTTIQLKIFSYCINLNTIIMAPQVSEIGNKSFEECIILNSFQ